MSTEIINIDYLKKMVDMKIANFLTNHKKQFQDILENVFSIPIENHFLLKQIYNNEASTHNVFLTNNQLMIIPTSGQSFILTLEYNIHSNEIFSMTLKNHKIRHYVNFKNKTLKTYKNKKLINSSIKIDSKLNPLENKKTYYPNGNIKKEQIFNSESAIKIQNEYSLEGKTFRIQVELRNKNRIDFFYADKKLKIASNNKNIKEFCEENIDSIEDIEFILPLIEMNFL